MCRPNGTKSSNVSRKTRNVHFKYKISQCLSIRKHKTEKKKNPQLCWGQIEHVCWLETWATHLWCLVWSFFLTRTVKAALIYFVLLVTLSVGEETGSSEAQALSQAPGWCWYIPSIYHPRSSLDLCPNSSQTPPHLSSKMELPRLQVALPSITV